MCYFRFLILNIFRGFLKSDKLLGTVTVKLHGLDSECTVHDSYDVSHILTMIMLMLSQN